MVFEAFYPRHPILSQHISYYYFAQTPDRKHISTYYSFPNTTVPVNIHKNVTVAIHGNKTCVTQTREKNHQIIINPLRQQPLIVKWAGIIDKATIAFKAGSLTHFMNGLLTAYSPTYSSLFTAWNHISDFDHFLQLFYDTKNNIKRVEHLETFLLQLYHPLEQYSRINEAIKLLADFNKEYPIAEIARYVNMAERSFNRRFHEYTGVSPIVYRKIARFRQSLENKVVKDKSNKLTDIGYESNYYDQSYFIKMYNKLSGKSPKDLYKAVTKLADDNVIFEFL